jgi:uncharacterized membrane protein YidH (DUF202 family)
MQTPGWIIIGAAFALFACVLVALAIGAAGGSAVQDALAADQTASATQRSVNVCVGILNLGACRSEQQSVSTTTRSTQHDDTNPLGFIAIGTIIVMAAVAAVVLAKPEIA